MFVAKIKPGVPGRSALQFSTYIGDAGVHVATGLGLGSNGEVYVAGYTNLGMPAMGAAAQPYFGGISDGFILTLSGLSGTPAQPKAAPRTSFTREPSLRAPRTTRQAGQ